MEPKYKCAQVRSARSLGEATFLGRPQVARGPDSAHAGVDREDCVLGCKLGLSLVAESLPASIQGEAHLPPIRTGDGWSPGSPVKTQIDNPDRQACLRNRLCCTQPSSRLSRSS